MLAARCHHNDPLRRNLLFKFKFDLVLSALTSALFSFLRLVLCGRPDDWSLWQHAHADTMKVSGVTPTNALSPKRHVLTTFGTLGLRPTAFTASCLPYLSSSSCPPKSLISPFLLLSLPPPTGWPSLIPRRPSRASWHSSPPLSKPTPLFSLSSNTVRPRPRTLVIVKPSSIKPFPSRSLSRAQYTLSRSPAISFGHVPWLPEYLRLMLSASCFHQSSPSFRDLFDSLSPTFYPSLTTPAFNVGYS
ncbi:hypothetical protein EI94DRAFT_1836093 [Lactarius quietus]|nr:hypothetical protein EI94DRAFT_1836093 [Lactarius quietus]